MIGLSLSLCIKDIIEGRAEVEAVERIITGTMAVSERDWESVLRIYCEAYWKRDPALARALVARLLAEGKITQPRLCEGLTPNLAASGGWWVQSMAEVVDYKPNTRV